MISKDNIFCCLQYALGSVLIFNVSCRERIEISPHAYIIGDNNIVRIEDSNIKDISEAGLNSAVLIATTLEDGRKKFCSGFIASKHPDQTLDIIFNHHCNIDIDEHEERKNMAKEVLPVACKNTVIYFGFIKGKTEASAKTKCKPKSLRTYPEADLAVLTTESVVDSKYTPLAFWPEENIPKDRQAYMIHFPDIAENYEKLKDESSKLPVAAITKDDCKTLGEFPREEWHLDTTLPISLKSHCDYKNGSSGSGLIDKETNTLLGINWGGIKIKYSTSEIETYNVSIKSHYVKAFLENNLELFNKQSGEVQQSTEKSGDSNASQPSAKKKNKSRVNIKKQGCGSILSSDSGNSPLVIMMLVLLLPVFMPLLKR